ncbi:hypothetical protein G7046_g2034 [Stylonectria norvegica]|nr:hypothetical protein G7046_g2034 [Stylonectria norvegica]
MRPTNYLPKPALLLSTLVSISLYGAPAFAQKSSSDDNKNTNTDKTTAPAAATTTAAPANTNTNTNTNTDKTTAAPASDTAKDTSSAESSTSAPAAASTTTQAPASSSTTQPESTSEPATTQSDDPTSTTESSDPVTTTTTSDIQTTLSSISDGNTDSGLTGLPTLTRTTTAIPTYPAPTVPPTNNAPFMQHSSAPAGTVFIAVGAILGAFGVAILLWRAIVGFLLHRSVERAARAQHDANAKAGFPAPPAPFYKYTDQGSTMSLSAGRGVRRTNRGATPSTNPSQSALFFSPTAAASGNPGGNRGSTFLPSGFYAAGNNSSNPNHEHSISLTNLRPDSRGQFGNPSRHTLGTTPPDSPSFNARRDISNSSLNLNRPPSQRAPSAFLEDLLADDPGSLPPPQMPPSSGHRNSGYHTGSPGPQNRF